jgi:hypothetical protein
MFKLQKKPSALKREHPALQNMKFLNFSTFVDQFCSPGSGSTDPIESGSNPGPGPDPKHWVVQPDLVSEYGRNPDEDPSFEIELVSDPQIIKI